MLKYNNKLSLKEYCELRLSVAWESIIEEQAQSGLDNSDFIIACRDDNNIVGCARNFWDKGCIAYLADVMVQVCKCGERKIRYRRLVISGFD